VAAFPAAKPLLRRAASSEQHGPASAVGFPTPTRAGASPACSAAIRAKELRRYFRRPVLLNRSCCLVPSGGAPLEVLRAYIESQAGADQGPLAAPRRPPSSRSGRAHCAAIGVDQFIALDHEKTGPAPRDH